MKLSISVMSQGIWSAMSFLIAILLVRYLDIEEYGWFAVFLAIRQFALMFLGALVLTPATVLTGEMGRVPGQTEELLRLVTKILQIIIVLILVTGALAGLVTELPGLSVAVFLSGALAAELQRRICYINLNYRGDLIGGIFNLVLIPGGIMMLARSGQLTLESALAVMGIVSLAWAMMPNRAAWYPLPRTWSPLALAGMWRLGKWGLGSSVANYVYSRTSTWYTLLLLGPSSVAVLELGRQLVTIIQSLIAAMGNYWQPIMARTANQDPLPVYLATLWKISLWQTLGGGLALLGVLLISPWLVSVIVIDNLDLYMVAIPVAWCLAGAMIAQLLWQHPNFTLTVLGHPDYAFYAKVVSAVIVLPAGYFLTSYYDVLGAAWAWTLGEGIILVMVVLLLRRVVRQRTGQLQQPVGVSDAG